MLRTPVLVTALALALTAVACGDQAPAPAAVPPPQAPPVSTAPTPVAARHPGDVLDLANWYLTLPTGRDGDPDDVFQPDLARYSGEWFHLDEAGDGVVFTADAGGVTTPGSSYPRSELRETAGGELAAWSNTAGTHVLDVRQAVTRLPEVKPHVVTAQIHDAEDDVVEVRLEGRHLIAEYDDGDGEVTLDPDYVLGTPFDLQIAATQGRVRISYDGTLAADLPLSGAGWYFKVGSYVQSNPARGDRPDAVAAVVVYALRVTHTN